jgi:hypothetical protein
MFSITSCGLIQHVQYYILWSHSSCSVLHLVSFSPSVEDEGLVQCYAIWIVDGSDELGALVTGNVLSYPGRLHDHLVNHKSSIVQVLIGSHT